MINDITSMTQNYAVDFYQNINQSMQNIQAPKPQEEIEQPRDGLDEAQRDALNAAIENANETGGTIQTQIEQDENDGIDTAQVFEDMSTQELVDFATNSDSVKEGGEGSKQLYEMIAQRMQDEAASLQSGYTANGQPDIFTQQKQFLDMFM